MPNPTKTLAVDIDHLYSLWLQSVPLRTIAAQLDPPVSHSTVAIWFRKRFGPNATDPKANSLARSLLEDYQGNTDTLGYVLGNLGTLRETEGNHRSNHSIQMLTRYQTATQDGILDHIAVYGPEDDQPVWDYLRLPWVIFWLSLLVDMLVHQCYTDGEVTQRSHVRT